LKRLGDVLMALMKLQGHSPGLVIFYIPQVSTTIDEESTSLETCTYTPSLWRGIHEPDESHPV
jgi:hypothetical protein